MNTLTPLPLSQVNVGGIFFLQNFKRKKDLYVGQAPFIVTWSFHTFKIISQQNIIKNVLPDLNSFSMIDIKSPFVHPLNVNNSPTDSDVSILASLDTEVTSCAQIRVYR